LVVFGLAVGIERCGVGAAESGATLAAIIIIFFPEAGCFWVESG
jgi:hypothetical protein